VELAFPSVEHRLNAAQFSSVQFGSGQLEIRLHKVKKTKNNNQKKMVLYTSLIILLPEKLLTREEKRQLP